MVDVAYMGYGYEYKDEEQMEINNDRAYRVHVEHRQKTLKKCIERAERGYWKTKTDSPISAIEIKSITTNHLKHVINMVERKNWHSCNQDIRKLLNPLYNELKSRKGINQ
jgi:hypothetical protein